MNQPLVRNTLEVAAYTALRASTIPKNATFNLLTDHQVAP